jgi:tRNA A-37 threonylcarbamoyl transferase component Bud32
MKPIKLVRRSEPFEKISQEFKEASEAFFNNINDARNKILTDKMEEFISLDDFKKILSYVQINAAEIIAEALEDNEKYIVSDDKNKNGDNLVISASIISSETKLPRTFAITYDPLKQSFTVKIYLNSKTAAIDPSSGKYKKGPAIKGADNKFSELLIVEFSKNNPDPKIYIDKRGRLVYLDKHSSNEELIRKAKLQAALAELNICLPVTILPVGKKGKLSLEVPYAETLANFNLKDHTPEEMQQIYKDIIEKVEQLRKMGMVHGDLKQENILIRDGRAYIADLDTLGFVDQVHVPKGTWRYLTPCAILSVFRDSIELDSNVLPTEVRKAMTYSPSSDLYALANLISRSSQSNNLDGNKDFFGKIDEILLPYLNPTNDCYTILNDSIPSGAQSLSLHDLYNKMFNKDLEVPVDEAKENAAIQALNEYVAPRVQNISPERCVWAFYNVKYDQVNRLIENILLSNDELNDKVTEVNIGKAEVKKIPINANVKHLIELLNSSGGYEYKINECRKYLLDLVGDLFSNGLIGKHLNFLNDANAVDIDVYKDKLLIILQIISLIIIQAQLTNVELISAKKASVDDLSKLFDIEKIFVGMFVDAESAQDRLEMVQKNKNKKVSTVVSLEDQNQYLSSLADIVDADSAYAKTFKLKGGNERKIANDYFSLVNMYGFPFSKISMSVFRKLSIGEQQQLIVNAQAHLKNLVHLKGVYAKYENSTDQITAMNAGSLNKLLNVHINAVIAKLPQMERVRSLALLGPQNHSHI